MFPIAIERGEMNGLPASFSGTLLRCLYELGWFAKLDSVGCGIFIRGVLFEIGDVIRQVDVKIVSLQYREEYCG